MFDEILSSHEQRKRLEMVAGITDFEIAQVFVFEYGGMQKIFQLWHRRVEETAIS